MTHISPLLNLALDVTKLAYNNTIIESYFSLILMRVAAFLCFTFNNSISFVAVSMFLTTVSTFS